MGGDIDLPGAQRRVDHLPELAQPGRHPGLLALEGRCTVVAARIAWSPSFPVLSRASFGRTARYVYQDFTWISMGTRSALTVLSTSYRLSCPTLACLSCS